MRKHSDTYLPPGFYSEVIRKIGIEQTELLTPREVDVLACVYMGMQDRHIKEFLSIEESVVQSHLSNARSKLGINRKRDVPGYIKTSEKSHIFETHYKFLEVESLFKKQLVKVSKLLSQEQTCKLIFDLNDQHDFAKRQLIKHLSLAGFRVKEKALRPPKKISVSSRDIDCVLYVFGNNDRDRLLLRNPNQICTIGLDIVEIDNMPQSINPGVQAIIALKNKEAYYTSVLTLLNKLFSPIDLTSIIQEFEDKKKNIFAKDDISKKDHLSSSLGTEIIVKKDFKNRNTIINALPNRNPKNYFESKPLDSNDSYLALLKKRLNNNDDQFDVNNKHIITGMGGIGKTQLALAIAYDSLGSFDVVGWINCGGGNQGREEELPSNFWFIKQLSLKFKKKPTLELSQSGKSTFINSCISLLCQLGVATDDNETIESVSEKLKYNLQNRNLSWLLIYDDAPSVESLNSLMPQNGGHIIITTRDQTSAHLDKIFNLDVFQPSESIDFLLRETESEPSQENNTDALRVAVELGYLPLALSQAASYMNMKKKNFKEYLNDFENQKVFLLSHRVKVSGYPYVVYTVWSISMKELPALAQKLMIYFSYLDANNIPISLFKNEKLGMSFNAIESSIDALLELSIIKRFREDKVSVHPLIQTVTSLQKEEQKIKHIKTLLKLLIEKDNHGFYFFNLNRETVTRLRDLIPHVLKVFKHAEQFNLEENIILGLRIASFFNREHRYQEAVELLKHLQKLANGKRKLRKKFDRAIRNNLINSYINMDDHENVRGIFIDDLPALSKAVVSHCLFNYKKAEDFYWEALKEYEYETESDSSNLNSQLNLALAYKNIGELYFAQGKFSESSEHLEQARRIYMVTFRDERNDDIASTLAYLAKIKQWQSNYEEATSLFKHALNIFSELYPQGNTEMLRCIIDYTATLEMYGRTTDSLEQCEKAMEIAKTLYNVQENLAGSNERMLNNSINLYDFVENIHPFRRDLDYEDRYYRGDSTAWYNEFHPKLAPFHYKKKFEILKNLILSFPQSFKRSRKRTIDSAD